MSQPRSLPDYPDEIITLPMFHPDISKRHQAEEYVHQHSQGEGSFLVRPNTDNDPSYVSITVSILGNKTCNAKVYIEKMRTGNNYFISDKIKFPTFNDLLSYYCEHRIHCQQGINVRLLLPLRKINPQVPRKFSLNNLTVGHRPSSSSSNSDETGSKHIIGSKDDTSKERKNFKIRSASDPDMRTGMPAALLRPHNRQSTSRGNVNNKSQKQDARSVMICRPPAPLPRPEPQSPDDNFYYTSIDANKDFFHETYQFLKANELCECGLRICDSELALGWTIHRSQDPATRNHIFFQHGEHTTWDMPNEVADELTEEQMMFIIYLCREGKQRVPVCLRKIFDRMFGNVMNGRRQ